MGLYKKLPNSFKSKISQISYWLSNKPCLLETNLKKSLFPGSKKSGIIISADFELGWAVRYSKHDKDPDQYSERERNNIPIILDLLEKYEIPVTWATVGHLFLKECNKGDHDWMARLPHFDDHWKFTEGDWFDCDPYGRWDENPSWYAPDLIKKILNCKTKQEIACHTFSHIDCSYKNCPPAVIDDEFKASTQIAREWGITFKSLTFPGGTFGNYETLKKYGIDICRRRVGKYEIAYPFRNEHGILVTPTGPAISMGYKEWSIDYLFSKYRKAIDKTIKNNSLIHFWFHPSQEEETFTTLFPLILEYIASKRKEDDLWVGTMGELSEHINSNNII